MAVQAGRIARERDRANREAAAAKQVTGFLVGLFKVSDPSEARGNSLTAREILGRGSAGRRNASPRSTAGAGEPRIHDRYVYTGLGLYDEARPLLERALRTQKALQGEDAAETLATANSLASLYLVSRRLCGVRAALCGHRQTPRPDSRRGAS